MPEGGVEASPERSAVPGERRRSLAGLAGEPVFGPAGEAHAARVWVDVYASRLLALHQGESALRVAFGGGRVDPLVRVFQYRACRLARVCNNLGIVLAACGALDGARASLESSAIANREQGEIHAVAQSDGNLGLVSQLDGNWTAAASHYVKAHEVFTSIDDQVSLVEIVHNLRVLPTRGGQG